MYERGLEVPLSYPRNKLYCAARPCSRARAAHRASATRDLLAFSISYRTSWPLVSYRGIVPHICKTGAFRKGMAKSWVRRVVESILSQGLIWGLVCANVVRHVLWRSEPWGGSVFGIDICRTVTLSLLAMQTCCWARTMFQPRTAVPTDMASLSHQGEASKRTDQCLPPRSRMCRGPLWAGSEPVLVLGFDHFCGQLGVPIGLHNRKFFVQFLLWSALLCAAGAGISASSYLEERSTLPPADGVSRGAASAHDFPPSGQVSSWIPLALSPVLLVWKLGSCAFGWAQTPMMSLDAYMMLVDLAAGIVLLAFGVFHLRLVARNATTLEQRGGQYDVGRMANFQQVFGRHIALWFVPLHGAGPTVDGIHYPER